MLAGPSLTSRFLAWECSDYAVGLVIFAIIFALLYVISGILFPKRNVLAEYGRPARPQTGSGSPSGRRAEERKPASPIGPRSACWRYEATSILCSVSSMTLDEIPGLGIRPAASRGYGGCGRHRSEWSEARWWRSSGRRSLVVFVPLLWLNSKGSARRRAFETQVPNTLSILAGSLQSRTGIRAGYRVAATEALNPTASELNRVLAQQRLGVAPEEALRESPSACRSEAFDWVVMSHDHPETGGRQPGRDL